MCTHRNIPAPKLTDKVNCETPSSLPCTPLLTASPLFHTRGDFCKTSLMSGGSPYFPTRVLHSHTNTFGEITPLVFPAYKQQSSHGAGTGRATLHRTQTSASSRGERALACAPALDLAQQAPAVLRTRSSLKLNLRSVPIKDMAAV